MVSIIIPTVRPKRVRVCCDAIRKHADGIGYEIITMYDEKRIGAPKMVARLVELTNFDLVMFLGDDTIPKAGFLKESLKVMRTFPDGWGLVGLNVEQEKDDDDRPATHWLAHKKLLDHLDGEFFHTGYYHCFCDNELTLRCKAIGRFKRAEKAVIGHYHPIFKNADTDADYNRVYQKNNFMDDYILFLNRKTGNWKNDDIRGDGL